VAPRAPETFEAFLSRLRGTLDQGGTQLRFGQHHFSHAVCVEDGVYRVRRLECTKEEAEAYLREHGIFMPEHAEAISAPRTLVFEAPTLDGLIDFLRERWPL
jgi:hypothetical protein